MVLGSAGPVGLSSSPDNLEGGSVKAKHSVPHPAGPLTVVRMTEGNWGVGSGCCFFMLFRALFAFLLRIRTAEIARKKWYAVVCRLVCYAT